MTFKELQVAEPLLRALRDKKYVSPTPIQQQAIPLVLDQKDILGTAQTGTGKTAAFALPIIQMIDEIKKTEKDHYLKALIVTPTRELAIQIDDNIRQYAKYTRVRHTVVFGGVNQYRQVERLNKGVDLLVATPGRLLDLIGQGFISLDYIKLFVLDEADRMLDMGFIHDIKKLLKLIPDQRQSLFFSATMPDNIVELSQRILKDPVKIEVHPNSSTADMVDQVVYMTNRATKKDLLFYILRDESIDQVLLFTRTKRGADKLARILKKKNIISEALHGDKGQNQRQKALNQFKNGKIRVLVATDIAARGIDIDKLPYVFNYDIPNVPETYVHRIGRSGRAGENGMAISICEPEENIYIRNIERLISQRIEVVNDHPFPQTDNPMTDQEKKAWHKEKQRRKMTYFAQKRWSANR